MYPQPNISPMVAPQIPATMADKKREMQYNIQQHLTSPNPLYGQIRSTPSPHPQPYGMDYGPHVPHMIPGGMYGHTPMAVYAHSMRHPRRNDVILPSQPPRSALLDEFRANKVRKWELRDIFGFIVEFSGDQHGSRFIQQKLEIATMDDKEMVFNEIVPNNTLQLIRDVFGNYVIQKLFEHGTQVHKTKLVNIMEGHVLTLSLQMYGCRVVQKAIEFILPEQQGMFIKELEPYVLKCVKDSNGNHVIQKLVECVSPDRLGFVNTFHGNVYDLASHPYGCRVLQRCLENLPDEFTRPLMEELHKYAINLMQNQFGNYVIQYILEHGKLHDKAMIVSKLRGQILQMARHKFASNVCEKALVCTDTDSRRALIDEIMAPRPDGVTPIIAMMKDQYANYVLQRALAVVEGDQREVLISKIKPQLVSMRRYANAYTKHLNSIERLVEKYPKQLESVPQLAITPPEHTR
ncbi:ARM repeat-containing protein [Collybia nuda]|uniref:Pumilio homology domain family member 3 n=1 Tax=Collybia nuda TaxID=64659 RepID=A0A9P6CG08_9AGAR|nr:ARM repeat-containing protein [Collybia nuda]